MAYPCQKPQRGLLPAVLCQDPGSPMLHAVVGGAPSLGDSKVISAFADQGSSSHLIAPRTNPHHSAHFGSHRIGRRKSGTKEIGLALHHFHFEDGEIQMARIMLVSTIT